VEHPLAVFFAFDDNGSMPVTRRRLFRTAAAIAMTPVLRSAEHSGLITLSPSPEDLEMPVAGFMDEITPVENFFVRCHTMIPKVSLADWKLEIGGLVNEPKTFTLDDLRKFPHVTLISVLECAGNGRSFYQPRLPGAQWQLGSVGNARWTGVRLRDVLAKVGVKPGATQLLMDGADVPMGKMPDFQRTLEVKKALHPDTLLAWEMNGKPLTAEHGFPLRVIAPGWASDSWCKWLVRLEAMDHDFDGFWMKTAYRHPPGHVAPGTAVDPKDMVPVTDLKVKSVIGSPEWMAKPGAVTVGGMAWSNASPVTKVDISTDAGKTWAQAKLSGTPTKYGFRRFTYKWQASDGEHTLMSRATNAAGQTQPMEPEWNPNGYLYNAAQPRTIQVMMAGGRVPRIAQPEGPPPESYKEDCMTCHDDHMMRQQHITRAQWDREITKMTGWGAQVKPEDRNGLLDYLAANFKP
jgi:sulfite oxidase